MSLTSIISISHLIWRRRWAEQPEEKPTVTETAVARNRLPLWWYFPPGMSQAKQTKSLRGPRMQGRAAGPPGDPVPVCGRTMGGMRSLSAGLTLDI